MSLALSERGGLGSPGCALDDVLKGPKNLCWWWMPEAGRAGKHRVRGRVTLGKQLSGFPSNMVGDVYKEASDSQPISNTAFGAILPFLSVNV